MWHSPRLGPPAVSLAADTARSLAAASQAILSMSSASPGRRALSPAGDTAHSMGAVAASTRLIGSRSPTALGRSQASVMAVSLVAHQASTRPARSLSHARSRHSLVGVTALLRAEARQAAIRSALSRSLVRTVHSLGVDTGPLLAALRRRHHRARPAAACSVFPRVSSTICASAASKRTTSCSCSSHAWMATRFTDRTHE